MSMTWHATGKNLQNTKDIQMHEWEINTCELLRNELLCVWRM